ncbi:hypothetical protein Aple_103620 [Acrocarpospora pleiomorpha]|uniref:Uncharacterized protein n=1 Tax=Acrocarpospora pleiomorpha TaxID=90975 RepID=A0A5M3Y2D1_9ACTN|nr:hypothetical protein Aple_103620 [Acrocarpospora pleiomorpha]
MSTPGCPGYCGSCVTPCFLRGATAPVDPVIVHEVAYSDLAHDLGKSDTDALGCKRWEDLNTSCLPKACVGNFFCWREIASDGGPS